MKITTAWTLPGLPIRERVARTTEAMWRGLAHRLPRRLAYWSLIDSGVRAMRDDDVVPDVKFMDVLQRTGKDT